MDVRDLIEQLCTLAGMIMEDESVTALSRSHNLSGRVQAIQKAAGDLSALAAAAQVLVQRL